MEIIAHIGESRVMVAMTRTEFAMVTGKRYEMELESKDRYVRSDGFEIGRQYDVSPVFNRLLRQEEVKDQLSTAARTLESLAVLIRQVEPASELITQQPINT